jgi:hypothetical protein
LREDKIRGKNLKARGAGAMLWELLDFSIFKHSRRDLQGVIFQKNEMEES